MATFYVSNAATNGFAVGHDTNNDGTTKAAPWLTLTGAIGKSFSAGDIISVNAGTYDEGNWNVTKTMSGAGLTIQSDSGVASGVIIIGGETTTPAVMFTTGSAFLTFKNVTIKNKDAGTAYAVRLRDSTNITLDGCIIDVSTSTANPSRGVWIAPSSTTITNTVIKNCTFNCMGTLSHAIYAAPTAATEESVNNITIQDCIINATGSGINLSAATNDHANSWGDVIIKGCTITTAQQCIRVLKATGLSFPTYANANTFACSAVTTYAAIDMNLITGLTMNNVTSTGGVTGLNITNTTGIAISGGTYSGGTAYGICLGTDDPNSGTDAVSGTILTATVSSTTSHAFLVGAGCTGITIKYCTINGGSNATAGLGLIFKMAQNCIAARNTIKGGANASLYFKGATNCSACGNVISNTNNGASCVQVLIQSAEPATSNSGISCLGNTLIYSNGAFAMNVGVYGTAGVGDVTGTNYIDSNLPPLVVGSRVVQ